MSFLEIAQSLGIKNYPAQLDAIYEEVKQGARPLFDRDLVDRHQQERKLFGEYYEDVVKGLEDLQSKPNALMYTMVGACYLQKVSQPEAKKLPLPEPDGSTALDMLPLFVLLPMVDRGLAEYEKRGTSREQAEAYMHVIRYVMGVNIRRHGRPGLDKPYFDQIALYMYGVIFRCEGFKFDLCTSGKFYYVLKSKNTGKAAVLLHGRDIHRSGNILGAAGMEDEAGAFYAEVTETDTAWIGHAVGEDSLVEKEKQTFSKKEWALAVAPGDCIMDIHIPSDADLSPEKTRAAITAAFRHAATYYADYAPKAIHCGSWMLNPQLKDILGEGSKLHGFASMFARYPTKCQGKSVFDFVFKASANQDLATLPEDTRLQRALKEKYLAGGYHHNFGGFILPEETTLQKRDCR